MCSWWSTQQNQHHFTYVRCQKIIPVITSNLWVPQDKGSRGISTDFPRDPQGYLGTDFWLGPSTIQLFECTSTQGQTVFGFHSNTLFHTKIILPYAFFCSSWPFFFKYATACHQEQSFQLVSFKLSMKKVAVGVALSSWTKGTSGHPFHGVTTFTMGEWVMLSTIMYGRGLFGGLLGGWLLSGTMWLWLSECMAWMHWREGFEGMVGEVGKVESWAAYNWLYQHSIIKKGPTDQIGLGHCAREHV